MSSSNLPRLSQPPGPGATAAPLMHLRSIRVTALPRASFSFFLYLPVRSPPLPRRPVLAPYSSALALLFATSTDRREERVHLELEHASYSWVEGGSVRSVAPAEVCARLRRREQSQSGKTERKIRRKISQRESAARTARYRRRFDAPTWPNWKKPVSSLCFCSLFCCCCCSFFFSLCLLRFILFYFLPRVLFVFLSPSR